MTLAHQQVQMGHNDHREEIIALQNQSQLIEDENNELKKKVTFYEEEFRKVYIICGIRPYFSVIIFWADFLEPEIRPI